MGLRNPQHERFALLVGSGQEPKPAWGEAFGRAPKGKEADELAADPDVAIRIREVQERAADLVLQGTVYSRVWAFTILGGAIQKAFEEGKYATAIRGIELIGRMAEHRWFPNESRVLHTKDRYADMGPKEILAMAREVGLVQPEPVEIEGEATRVEDGDGSPVH